MYELGNKSLEKLGSAHEHLQFLAKEAIHRTVLDFSVLHGHRDKALQNSLFRSGASQVKWPFSKHNKKPAEAIDIGVYKDGEILWEPLSFYYYLYGVFDSIAREAGIKITSGLNWDRDADFTDQTFLDGPHVGILL